MAYVVPISESNPWVDGPSDNMVLKFHQNRRQSDSVILNRADVKDLVRRLNTWLNRPGND